MHYICKKNNASNTFILFMFRSYPSISFHLEVVPLFV